MRQFISLKAEIGDALRGLRNLRERDIPIVVAFGLTKTAQDVKAAEVAAMQRHLDRPRTYTLNALFVKPATKVDLQAMVGFKRGAGVPPSRYLSPQEQGGPRRHKSFEKQLIAAGVMSSSEFAMPGQGVQLDANGNMRRADITRILSGVKAAKVRPGGKAGRKPAAGSGVYAVIRGGKAPDGIYQRISAREIRPVLIFTSQPRYQKRLPYYETAEQVARARIAINMREGFARYGQPRRNKK